MSAHREKSAMALVMLIAAAVAVIGARPYAGAWNDGSRLAAVECLVDHGTLAIDDSIFVLVPPADEPAAAQPFRGVANGKGTLDKLLIDGHFYSDKSPVPTLLLAIVYKILQLFSGLVARVQPGVFCWCMTVASSGVAYVVAAVCVFRMGKVVGLTLPWRLFLTGSFALATVAVVYVQHVNNHMLLLGVAAAFMLQASQLAEAAPWWRLALLGGLAGLAYAIDLGAGPALLVCTGLLVIWQAGRPLVGGAWFVLGALPWLAVHHAVNFAVGGTFGPANAVVEYFQWPGCPFNAATLTGGWHHPDIASFGVYAIALLFGKRGFVGHDLPLFLLVPALWLLLRQRSREWPVLWLALAWSAGTWLVYAASSRNYSGANCGIRWLVPLLAPGYYAIALVLVRWPRWRAGFAVLTAAGAVLMAIAWGYGPWISHMVPGFWPIQIAALAGWAVVAWRGAKRRPTAAGLAGSPPHFSLQRLNVLGPAQEAIIGDSP